MIVDDHLLKLQQLRQLKEHVKEEHIFEYMLI